MRLLFFFLLIAMFLGWTKEKSTRGNNLTYFLYVEYVLRTHYTNEAMLDALPSTPSRLQFLSAPYYALMAFYH